MAGSKTSYQGGPFVDILTGHGKSPLEEFKITPATSVQKVFDKNVKGFVFEYNGGSVAKMQIPKDEKQSLNLVQSYIVFQLMIPHGQSFSIEFCISDGTKSKRRIHLSSAFNKPDSTPLHARVPLSFVQHGVWLNLCFDLISLVNNNFRGQSFRSLDGIVIRPSCTLRRIFTLRSPPFDTTNDQLSEGVDLHGAEPIPHTHDIPPDVGALTQVFTMEKLFYYLQLQQHTQQQQQQISPPPETPKSGVPLAFGRRVNSAGKGTLSQQLSPPLSVPPSHQPPIPYPSSPQTPNTRLAARAKAAASKPSPPAILTKPVTGRLPKVGSTASTKSNISIGDRRGAEKQLTSPSMGAKRINNTNNTINNINNNHHHASNYNSSNYEDGNNFDVDTSLSDYRPHRNITPVPHSSRLQKEVFSEIPPRSASPEIPKNDIEDDYPDSSSYYGSDEEFPVQNFDGVTLHKEYQSSRYQSNDNILAGSDRATAALDKLSLAGPQGYTSHINTKPVVKQDRLELDSWEPNTLPRLSADLSQGDIPLSQMEGRKLSSTTKESIEVKPNSARNTSSCPSTSSSRPSTSSSRNNSTSRPPTSTTAPRDTNSRPSTSTTRNNTTSRPPTSINNEHGDDSGRPLTSTRDNNNNNNNNPSRPPTGPSARPNSTSRPPTSSTKPRLKTPLISEDKSPARGQTAPSRKNETRESIGLQKPSTSAGRQNSARMNERKSNMDILAKVVQESEVHRPSGSSTARRSQSAGSSISNSKVEYTRQSGSRRNSMEAAYSRLVAESDLTGLKKDLGTSPLMEEDEEDDMVNMDDRDMDYDDEDDDFGPRDTGDSVERSLEEEEDLEVEEGDEIDEDIDGAEEEEEEEEEDYEDNYDGEVAEDLGNNMDKNEFTVESGLVDENHSEDESEEQLVFDSKHNAYYDTKNKKFVHLH